MVARCAFCGDPQVVARCTAEVCGHVCDKHFIPAAGNGFMPKRLDDGSVLLPLMAIQYLQWERRNATP